MKDFFNFKDFTFSLLGRISMLYREVLQKTKRSLGRLQNYQKGFAPQLLGPSIL
jgi:hypothetical protein